jgi:TPP-dependent pyruvate/acetoin dehydrogenase alpha subunit
LISREKLMQLYAAMVKSRMIAERAAELARQGKLPHDWGNETGSEATLAGIAADLRLDDSVSAPGNRLLWSVIQGIPLEKFFEPVSAPLNDNGRSVAGRNGNLSAGKNGHSAHLALTGALGIDLSAATQAAAAHKAANDGRIALVFLKDPAASDVPDKQLQFVSRRNLPMVLLCHFGSEERQRYFLSPRGKMNGAIEALAFGIARIAVDARDVLAVYRVASESISRARQRRGPTLIECIDDGLPARVGTRVGERGTSVIADPVRVMESYLGKKRLLTAALKQQIESQLRREVDAATEHLMN